MKKFFALLLSFCIVSAAALGLGTALHSFSEVPVYWEKNNAEELTDIGSPYKFYYSQLSNKEKHTYNAILKDIFDMPDKIEIPNINGFELERVFSALLCDNPELFFLSRVCSLEDFTLKFDNFVPQYSMERAKYKKCLDALISAAEKAEATYSAPGNSWQTELEIHDYITGNCEYMLNDDDDKTPTASAYGALVNGYASCEGYSKAMKFLLDRAGIKNSVVSGDATNTDGETVNHMWNAVLVGDGWYYVDCTWDDPVSEGKSTVSGHTYFNLSSGMIATTHSNFSFDFDCNGISENYHVRRGLYFEKFDRTCEDRLGEVIASELDRGNTHVELRFATKEAYEAAKEGLFESGDRSIDRILYNVMQKTDVSFSEYFKYVPDDLQYVLTLIISTKE